MASRSRSASVSPVVEAAPVEAAPVAPAASAVAPFNMPRIVAKTVKAVEVPVTSASGEFKTEAAISLSGIARVSGASPEKTVVAVKSLKDAIG